MRIIGYVCAHAGYAAADLAGEQRLHYSADVTLIQVPCLGRVDVTHLLRAFREGADAVFVAGCLEGNCHHHYGNFEAKKKVAQGKRILNDLGLGSERLEMFNVASNQAWLFKEVVDEMTARATRLAPNPLGARN